jgi:hypothetical protein
MHRPLLTVCGMTWNSGARLEHWLARTLEYADEVVLLVDAASTDDTLAIARAYTDRVQLVEHPPMIEVAMDWGLRLAAGEWVLWLDDDEFVGRAFATQRDRLLADPYLTHYWVPYRWVIGDEAAGYRWLRQFPWYPNERLRLVRNVGSVFHHRGRLHSPIDVAGEGRLLGADEAVIYHMDLAWRSREEREEKVARYRRKDAPSCEEYYLFEDYEATLDTEAVDAEDALGPPSPAARAAAQQRRRRPTGDEATNLVPGVATVAAMTDRIARWWDNADVFHADYVGHDTATTVLPDRGYVVQLTVRNTSGIPWRTSGPLRGRVSMSYHWSHPLHGLLLEEGDRALLPHAVEPGEAVRFPAGLWTPADPGRYLLQWDLVSEEVSWFSRRGVPPLEVEVEVADGPRPPTPRRSVATLPPRALGQPPRSDERPRQRAARMIGTARSRWGPSRWAPGRWKQGPPKLELGAANVVPVPPVRVLDTRDGTGAPGAVVGPLAAGTVVELAVGGHLGIPSHALAVVAGLSVPEATYNGLITAFAADGTTGDAFVSAYFNDQGRPSTNQVVVALGRGERHGKLALHASANHPGTLQLIVDVVAYVG